ncbi:MAG: hypothetical protein CMP07_09200 [Xanthomonadales bacterium]|nr:hypothetical protein [Xanthomonadales bacterium]
MPRLDLPPAEYAALLAAAPRIITVWMLLPVTGIARIRRWLGKPRQGRAPEYDPELWRRRVIAIRRIGARLPGCHCLARSITLSNWLNRAGHPNTLKIGITGTAATLKSHSWVEKDNEILDDTPENIQKFHKITEI